MIAATRGIVLRNTKYGDNKNIVTLLTEDFGKMSYMVYASHSKRASIRNNTMQLLSVLDLQVEHRDGKNLQRIKEASPLLQNYSMIYDPLKAAFSFFVAEVVDKSIYAPEKDKEVFGFLMDYIENFVSANKISGYAATDFLMEFSKHLGFYPYDGADNEFLQIFRGDGRLTDFLQYLQGHRDFDHASRRDILHLAVDYFRLNLPDLRGFSSVAVLESFFSAQ